MRKLDYLEKWIRPKDYLGVDHSDSYIDQQLPNPTMQILLPELIHEFEYDQNHYLKLKEEYQ